MIKVENIDVWGFEHAVRGMRNPLNSWGKSDSDYEPANLCDHNFVIGENDLGLMKRLYKAGTEHRKYLRQIFVSMDIVAPDYWFKEFSTYRIGVTENSTSTMHKIASKEFTLDDFSCEHLINFHGEGEFSTMGVILNDLNWSRTKYLETKDKKYWWQMIQLLPMSYNYRRTVTMNYENVVTIIRQRSGHKLDEWNDFIKVLKTLPYIEEIMEEG